MKYLEVQRDNVEDMQHCGVKTYVDEEGHVTYFDMVPGEHELRDGAPEVTGKLCVIGSKLDPEKLNELFQAQGRLSED